VGILDHPGLKDLQSETKRERLLCFKAFVEGFEAALGSVEYFGLEQAKVIHEHTMAELSKRLDGMAEADG